MEKLSDPQDVKEWYVNFSAESLKDEESDHEELTSPLLVIASVSKFEFRDENISKYTYGTRYALKLLCLYIRCMGGSMLPLLVPPLSYLHSVSKSFNH